MTHKPTPLITIFTPTYNREGTLPALYESLKNQQIQNFEWVIVDDGSTDNTSGLVGAWEKNSPFKITYVRQLNGGKHRAINRGVGLSSGELFFIADSDDWLTHDATKKIEENVKPLRMEDGYGGLVFQKGYSIDTPVGSTFTNDAGYLDAKSIDRTQNGISGDKAEVYYLKILKEFPFPEIENEKFIEEAYVWNLIALDGNKLRWFNDVIYICEYLEGGLTKSGDEKYRLNPKGYLLYTQQLLTISKGWINKLRLYSMYATKVYSTSDYRKAAKDLSTSLLIVYIAVICRRMFRR